MNAEFDTMTLIILGCIVLLLLISAFFSGAETALRAAGVGAGPGSAGMMANPSWSSRNRTSCPERSWAW